MYIKRTLQDRVKNISNQFKVLLITGAMNGAIFETFVISEIIKSYRHNLIEPNIYYYRDKDKKELDVIIEQNGKLYPIEIKKSASPNKKIL